MKTLKFSALCCIAMLAGCQQAEEIENMSKKLPMSVEASIGNSSGSRYASANGTGTPNSLVFTTNDAIGIFVNDLEAVKWEYITNKWSAGTTIYWPNETTSHKFYAFYPFPAKIPTDLSKSNVPMPSLAGQTGTMESLSECDFLVATKEQSYGTDGKVSFTGEGNSFKHVNSMVAITILKNSDLKDATINYISFSATNIASSTSFSFGDTETLEKINITEESNQMKSEELNFSMSETEDDKTYYFILNSGADLSKITFSISYSINDQYYTASKEGLGSGILTSGNRYNFSLNITDGILNFSGAEIVGWGEGENMNDIIINTPQTSPAS